MSDPEILATGRYLQLVRRKGWEFVRRHPSSGAVIIIAVTDDQKIILVEQHREPVQAPVLELPAGLMGDLPEFTGESFEAAAGRELFEETGYEAQHLELVFQGPANPGATSEAFGFVIATGLTRTGPGGGDDTEDITVHEVPLDQLDAFFAQMRARGALIDPKILIGTSFIGHTFTRQIGQVPAVKPGSRIALFGGSFNPPHLGHTLLAQSILATESIDEVWVLPVAEHPFGPKTGRPHVSFEHRLNMAKIAFNRLRDVRVLDIESRLPTPSYTVQTLEWLNQQLPDIHWTWVIGSDIVPQLGSWRDPEKLQTLARILVVPRQGYPLPPSELDLQHHRGFQLPEVSSTQIAQALKTRSLDPVRGLIDSRVLDYLQTHQLLNP